MAFPQSVPIAGKKADLVARLGTERAVEKIRRDAAEAALVSQRTKVKSLEVVFLESGVHLLLNTKATNAVAGAGKVPQLFSYADVEWIGLTTISGCEQPARLQLVVRPTVPGQNFCKSASQLIHMMPVAESECVAVQRHPRN